MERRCFMPKEIRLIVEDLMRLEEDSRQQEAAPQSEEDFDGSDIEDEESEDTSLDAFDSCSDVSEMEEMDEDFDPGDDFQFYIGQDMETFWCSESVVPSSRVRSKNTINILPGPKRVCRETPTEKDAFLKFITTSMIDDIVVHTNRFIEIKRISVQYARERDYKNTTREEIMGLIGALYLIGVKHGDHANSEELWKNDGSGMVVLRSLFGYKRFLFLLRSLRFDDLSTRQARMKSDKLAAIRNMYDDFRANCKNNYSPGEFVTVGEMLISFRGRCGWAQYMPNKPARRGLKFYSLCDSKTYYTWNFELYCGKQKPGSRDVTNKPHDVVMRLIEGIENSNRNITMDNYYTSYPLIETLMDKGLTALGTLKKNKKEIPPQFLSSKNRSIGSCIYGFQYDMTLASVQTKPSKFVVLLSSSHDKKEVDPGTGKEMIHADYNATKGAVDTVDNMCAAYPSARITRRWPLACFFRFLDIAGINAQIVYHFNNLEKVDRRRAFLSNLAYQLMEAHLKTRTEIKNLPNDVKVFVQQYRDESVPGPCHYQLPSQKVQRKGPCHVCPKKKWNLTTVKCATCYNFVCKNHSERVVNCATCTAGGGASDAEEEW